MCGIVGQYNLDGAPVDLDTLERMVALLHHRGPDDTGVHLFSLRESRALAASGKAHAGAIGFEGGLGFARLSIIDLSVRGHQPMANDDGTIIIAFNGEIYNALSFKAELSAAGFRFRGTSDTEVLLRLYEHFGLDGMLQRINGMFAIAIVDLRLKSVVLVRDETGIKPLLWACVGRTVLFGSEIKPFLAHPAFECRLAEEHIDEYLAFRYCAGDRHLFKGVNQLRPGHYVRFACGQDPVVRRYYAIPERSGNTPPPVDMLDDLERKLRDGVQSQLLADVGVGCQLSGGIDSSLVTLLANNRDRQGIESFSIIFRDQRFSEERWIAEAVEVAGVRDHRFNFEADDFFDSLEPATWHLEQPINHPNTLGLFHLAKRSRPFVKVLLSGEGADELMGGYNRFYYACVRSKVKSFATLMGHVPRFGEKWTRNFRPDLRDEVHFAIAASMHMRPEQLMRVRPGCRIADVLASRKLIFDEGRGDHLANFMKYEMQTHMVDLLLRQDRMTMAHSLEGRVPFLDKDLISFVRSLPSNALVGSEIRLNDRRMHNTKMPLKSLASRYFSDEFVHRPKSGFSLPLLDYYRDPRFVEMMEDRILPGMRKRNIIECGPVQEWWEHREKMPRTLDESFWVPIMLEVWAQQWLDADGRASRVKRRETSMHTSSSASV